MEDQTSTTPIRSATPSSKEPPRRDTHDSTAIDVQSPVQSGEPNNAGQLRRLQLELQLVRRQADAARLDAQAAALELAICKLTDSHSVGQLPKPASDTELKQLIEDLPAAGQSQLQKLLNDLAISDQRSISDRISAAEQTTRQLDDKAEQPKVAHTQRAETQPRKASKPKSKSQSRSSRQPKSSATSQASGASRPTADWTALCQGHQGSSKTDKPTATKPEVAANDSPQLAELSAQQTVNARRRRPSVWLASGILHAVLLLLLASWTLGQATVKDQVSIQASINREESYNVEFMEPLAAAEAVPEETPASEAEVEVDLGQPAAERAPITGIPAIEVAQPELRPSQPTVTTETLTTLTSDTQAIAANTKFCGIEGGGNNFVYLVDSSGSMGAAFESARDELMRAINALTAEQRFYVVFFDAESDYLNLSGDKREDFAVAATAANKQAFARWASKIQMDRGKAPYEALEFAINLQPDVIFLLSDGEFPQRIEDHLQELNHSENLFGLSTQSCIIHTIGYHSREGEERMQRIAQQHGGQYRHVPRP